MTPSATQGGPPGAFPAAIQAAGSSAAPLGGPAPALLFEHVTIRFGAYTAVNDASLHVGDGEFVSIVGPTGCGKSTLLNVAAGLLEPTEGDICVYGRSLEGINKDAGYLFQADALMPWRTALSNVVTGLEYGGVARAEAERLGTEWLARVGLTGHGERFPHELSGGMRKRVALAQTLIRDPKIVLMDEPFSALDVQTRVLMENELLQLWTTYRKSVLFITHDLEEAISLSDRVIILSAGPSTRPLAEFKIDLPRPRDVAEIRMTPRFVELYHLIWDAMKEEVLKAYERNQRKLAD
ncbi:ABC transporter ATP-binding protein [Xanthobacter autotrophicus]|uniref:ABC transporter ATP-binding protein n=1 Tax=Xanthobacter autotrophicus TaxID=280 RepID=UPI0037289FB4